MKTRSQTPFFLSVFAVIFVAVLAVSAQPGGYQPTDKDNAGVGLAADFAVKEQSTRSKTTITLASVVKAEDGDAKLGARNLRLCLSVTAAGKPLVAQAVVHVDQYSNYKLMRWAKSTCGKSATGSGASTVVEFKPDKDYKPLDSETYGLDLAAEFAVTEQAKRTKAKITPATVVKAESMEPKLGMVNFRLCLKTTVNGKATSAQAVVSKNLYSNHRLLSWTEMKCGGADGEGFTLVEKDYTAGVDMAADWAVEKHAKDTGKEHKLVEILKREERGMFAVTYRICMKVEEEGKTQLIQAVVSRDQYSNHKLVSWEHSKCTK